MDEETTQKHLMAGLKAGRESTCGSKINYKSELRAVDTAARMNQRKSLKELEAYPCVFCKGWHIGRKMSSKESDSGDSAPLS